MDGLTIFYAFCAFTIICFWLSVLMPSQNTSDPKSPSLSPDQFMERKERIKQLREELLRLEEEEAIERWNTKRENTKAKHTDSPIWLTRILGCETDEQCGRIQKGRMFTKRAKYWLVLSSFGTFLFIGEVISWTLLYIENLENEHRPSLVWRWTVGWFKDGPKPKEIVEIWRIYDTFEGLIFLIGMTIALRWAYADARCRKGRFPNFSTLVICAFLVNSAVYMGLQYYLGPMIQ